MSLPNAEEITNLFLYGTTNSPADFASDTLIRPTAAKGNLITRM
jgi:hypothetical protein